MIELKFRAWSAKEKRMFSCNDITLRSVNGRMVAIIYKPNQGGFQLQYDPAYVDDAVLMQYTGLKDKNGKEIYEGDIIKKPGYEDWDGDWVHEEIGEIKWEVSTARFTTHIGGQFIPNERSEVIGNIYENPELIKGVWK